MYSGSYSPEDDDILQEYGVPSSAFSVRPVIGKVVAEAQELSVRDARAATELTSPHGKERAFRCVVCTLPGGTCEHTDAWCTVQSSLLLEPSERSGAVGLVLGGVDEVDAQLSDLVDVLGLASRPDQPPPSAAALYSPSAAFSASAGRHGIGGGGQLTPRDDLLDDNDDDDNRITDNQDGNNHDRSTNGDDNSSHAGSRGRGGSASADGDDRGFRGSSGDKYDPLAAARALVGGCVSLEHASQQHERTGQESAGGGGGRALLKSWEVATVVSGQGFKGEGLLAPPPLRTVRWAFPEENCGDVIGVTSVDLSTPQGRGGHSLVGVDPFTLVSFGGFFCKETPGTGTAQRYRPFLDYATALVSDHSEVSEDGANYVNAVSVYDTVSQSWSVVTPGVVNPPAAAENVNSDDEDDDDEDGGDGRDGANQSNTSSIKRKTKAKGSNSARTVGGPAGRFGHVALWLGTREEASSGRVGRHQGTEYGNEDRQCQTGAGTHRANTGDISPSVPAAAGNRFALSPDLQLPDDSEATSGSGEMFMFGGRLRGGKCSNEAWLLHWPSPTGGGMQKPMWELLGPSAALSAQMEREARDPTTSAALLGLSSANMCLDNRAWPPPRYDAAAAVIKGGTHVAIHGGRDTVGGGCNHGDLWLWCRRSRHWEQPLIVGIPASPRYGHALVVLPGTEGQELLLLGGCTVSTGGKEAGISAEAAEDLDLQVSLAAQRVAHAYDLELCTAKLAASALRADAQAQGHSHVQAAWRGMVRDGAQVAMAMAQRERGTKREEEAFRDLLSVEAASKRWATVNGQNSAHLVGKGTRKPQPKSLPSNTIQEIRAGGGGGNGVTAATSVMGVASAHDIALNGSGGDGAAAAAGGGGSKSKSGLHHRGYEYGTAGGEPSGMFGKDRRTEFEKSAFGGSSRASRGKGKRDVVDGLVIDLVTRTYSPLEAKGAAPRARSHAAVAVVGGRVLVTGGQQPTDARAAMAAQQRGVLLADGHNQRDGGGGAQVHVLDIGAAYPLSGKRGMKTGAWRWVLVPPEKSPQWLETTATAAEANLRRAERALVEVKSRAQSEGVPGGETQALKEAKARVEVGKWRARTIRREQVALTAPPLGRAAAAFCTQGYRLLMHGGWRGDECVGGLLSVDLETADERQRRLKDEFAVKLEREVVGRAVAESLETREAFFLEKIRVARERKREQVEGEAMALEDILSSLPTLTAPSPPTCLCASADTMWLQWPAAVRCARGFPLPPAPPHDLPPSARREGQGRRAHYYLSMKGGFCNPAVGQRVRVAFVPVRAKQRKRDGDGDDSSTSSSSYFSYAGGLPLPSSLTTEADALDFAQKQAHEASNAGKGPAGLHDPAGGGDPLAGLRVFRGRVVRIHANGKNQIGHFDIVYDDGAKEYRVPRWRLRIDHKADEGAAGGGEGGEWQLLYAGPETSYEVQGLVPTYALAQEERTSVRCTFMVRTQFAEYTWDHSLGRRVRSDDLSQTSSLVSFNTRSLSEEERVGEYGEISELLALGEEAAAATAAAAAAESNMGVGHDSQTGGKTEVEAQALVAATLAKKKAMGGPKAAKKFKQAILLDNGVTLHVNGPGEVRADGGVGGGAI